MEKLIIDGEGDKPLEFELEHDVVTLGRNAENRISIQNRYLSQFHARFSRVEGKRGREILDLDSYNGTKVNGQRIMREMLRPGDTIQFGLLTARYESSGEVSRNKDAAPAKPNTPKTAPVSERKSDSPGSKNGLMPQGADTDTDTGVEIIKHNQLKLAIDRARTNVDSNLPELPRPNGNGSAKRAEKEQKELDRTRAELKRLKKKLADEQSEMTALKKQSDAKRDELGSTAKDLDKVKAEIQSANKELAEAKNSLANLQALSEAERSGLKSIGDQIKQLREEGDKVKGVEHSLAAKLDELQDATLELERLKSAIFRSKKESETAKIALGSSTEELQKAMAEHHAIVVRVAEARGDLEMLESDIKQKSSEIVRIKADRAHVQSLLDEEIRRLEEHTTEQTTVNLELEQSARKLARMKHEIGEAESRLETLTRESTEQEQIANTQLNEASERLARETLLAEEQEERAREIQRQVDDQIAQIAQLQAEQAALEAAVENQQAAVNTSDSGQAEAMPKAKSGKSLVEELADLGFNLQPVERRSDDS